MAKKFDIEIVAPDRLFYKGQTEIAIVRTTEGDMGIMHGHQPSVALLDIGSLRIKTGDGAMSVAACSKGMMTVKDSKVVILIESAEWVDEIDLERALQAKRRAQERLEHKGKPDIDFLRAKMALMRAINRINLSEKN